MNDSSNLIELLDVADEIGFKSLRQLKVFILHANNERKSIGQLTGFESTTPEYKRHLGVLRKLMQGSPDRNYDGLGLFYGNKGVVGMNTNEKSIMLTEKGKQWAKKLKLNI